MLGLGVCFLNIFLLLLNLCNVKAKCRYTPGTGCVAGDHQELWGGEANFPGHSCMPNSNSPCNLGWDVGARSYSRSNSHCLLSSRPTKCRYTPGTGCVGGDHQELWGGEANFPGHSCMPNSNSPCNLGWDVGARSYSRSNSHCLLSSRPTKCRHRHLGGPKKGVGLVEKFSEHNCPVPPRRRYTPAQVVGREKKY